MSFSEFLAQVKTKGLARNNRYAVAFHGNGVAGFDNNNLRSALLFCDSAQLPGQSYATVMNRSFGELRETPYDRLYEPITLSFYVDREMQVKYLFDRWMDKIASPATRKYNYYDDYVCNIAISVFDNYAESSPGSRMDSPLRWTEKNNETYVVVLHEAYPKSVSAVQLDQANKDVMKVTVTFQYKYWLSEPQEVYNMALGSPISPSIQRVYSESFGSFQQAYNQFNDLGLATNTRIPNPSTLTGGLPGFDGGLPDTQGFLTQANQALTNLTRGGLSGITGGRFPSLSDIMNLRF